MGRCFVVQPFDRGRFDKRYDDVFAPAIEKAGLSPYRVDRDPQVSVPIEDIENGITNSDAVLADITTDNPNVWFELGFAIACQREVVLVCSDERTTPFPFDVHHRSIIKYSTDSPSDFTELQGKITRKIQALMAKEQRLGAVASMSDVATVEGLRQHEVATLVAVAQQVGDPEAAVSAYMIRQDTEKAGFTQIATTLGLSSLLEKGLVESETAADYNGEEFIAYRVTRDGMKWLESNTDKLVLRRENPEPAVDFGVSDDDIPF